MKKALILCIFIGGVLLAGWLRVIGPGNEPQVPNKTVLKSDTVGVSIMTQIYGFNYNDSIVGSDTFKMITLPGEQVRHKYYDTARVGMPQVPYVRLLLAIPDSCGFDISTDESDYTIFENYQVYPVPRVVFESDSECIYSKEVFAYDTAFYEMDTVYPDKFYEIEDIGHWRDQRILEVVLYPIHCNPSQKEMYFYDNIDLTVQYTGKVVENRHGLGPFEDIGRDILLNYPGVFKELGERPPPGVHYYSKLKDTTNLADYIIVTDHEILDNKTAKKWIDSLANWRVAHNQFDVGIVKMNDIYSLFPDSAPDSSAQLRDFLVYTYDNWKALAIPDSHFAYCLFIGDWDCVPMETCFVWYPGNSGPPGSNSLYWMNAYEGYFRDIDDQTLNNQEDIMLGRLPVKTTYINQLVNIIKKTIDYEKYPDTGPWRRRGLLISGGGAGEIGFNNLVTASTPLFSNIAYDTNTVRWMSEDSLHFNDSMHYGLNRGELITAYFGHSGPNGWPPYFWDSLRICPDSLKNGDSLPVILSYSCNACMFQREHPYYDTLHPEGNPNYWQHDTVYAEHFLYNPNGGAVAFYGATSPTIFNYYDNVPIERVLRNQEWILGKALIQTQANTNSNCYCLLGDPALDLGDYTALPDLPDLVIRPLPPEDNDDIQVMTDHPYHTSGATIPLRVKVYNIGHDTAYNVSVKFDVLKSLSDTAYTNTVTISEISPRDTAIATTNWHTWLTHPGVYGEIGNVIWAEADPNHVITESWDENNRASKIEKIALYPNESGWPRKIQKSAETSQPVLVNLDGTGTAEIVYASVDSIYAIKPDGSYLIGWPQYFSGMISIVVGNLDCMGYPEVVAITQDSIKAYGYQGSVLWGKELPDSLPDYYCGFPAMGYVSGADKREVAVVNLPIESANPTNPKVLLYTYNGNLSRVFTCSHAANNSSNSRGPAISDVNGDGHDEIVLSYKAEVRPNTYYGTDIFNITNNIPVDTLDSVGTWLTIPALADLDAPADGYAELITSETRTKAMAYKARTGATLWQTETEGAINSSAAVGNIHPFFDGSEIAFGNDASRIYAIRGLNGSPLDPYPLLSTTDIRLSPALARLEGSGDGNSDIVIASNDLNVIALSYLADDTISPYPLPVFADLSSPVIGDIDGDRKSETVIKTDDGYLHVWENVNSGITRNLLEWPQFHHDYQRTGQYNLIIGFAGGDPYPEEFSSATTISFSLKNTSYLSIKIYDAQGNIVRALVDQVLPGGNYNPVWDGKNNNYALLPNGLYFIEFSLNNERRVVPVKINR